MENKDLNKEAGAQPPSPDKGNALLFSLLGAGIGGLGTGFMSSRIRDDEDDTEEGKARRRKRILRDALVGSTLGGAGGFALNHLKESPIVNQKDNMGGSPLERTLSNILGSPGVTGIGGATGLSLALRGTAKAENRVAQDIIKTIRSAANEKTAPALKAMAVPDVKDSHNVLRSILKEKSPAANQFRQAYGATSNTQRLMANADRGLIGRFFNRIGKSPVKSVTGLVAGVGIPYVLSKLIEPKQS